MIHTIPHGSEYNRSLQPFTGEVIARSTARPKYPAVFRNGRICRMRDGLDVLCLGIAKKVYFPHSYSRRAE